MDSSRNIDHVREHDWSNSSASPWQLAEESLSVTTTKIREKMETMKGWRPRLLGVGTYLEHRQTYVHFNHPDLDALMDCIYQR